MSYFAAPLSGWDAERERQLARDGTLSDFMIRLDLRYLENEARMFLDPRYPGKGSPWPGSVALGKRWGLTRHYAEKIVERDDWHDTERPVAIQDLLSTVQRVPKRDSKGSTLDPKSSASGSQVERKSETGEPAQSGDSSQVSCKSIPSGGVSRVPSGKPPENHTHNHAGERALVTDRKPPRRATPPRIDQEADGDPVSDDWRGLLGGESFAGVWARSIVEIAKVYTFEQARSMSLSAFQGRKGIGPSIAEAVNAAFTKRGWTFATKPIPRAGAPPGEVPATWRAAWVDISRHVWPPPGPLRDALNDIGGTPVVKALPPGPSFARSKLEERYYEACRYRHSPEAK